MLIQVAFIFHGAAMLLTKLGPEQGQTLRGYGGDSTPSLENGNLLDPVPFDLLLLLLKGHRQSFCKANLYHLPKLCWCYAPGSESDVLQFGIAGKPNVAALPCWTRKQALVNNFLSALIRLSSRFVSNKT